MDLSFIFHKLSVRNPLLIKLEPELEPEVIEENGDEPHTQINKSLFILAINILYIHILK